MSANKLCQRCGVTMFYSTEVFCQDCQEAQMARDPVTPAMTEKRNTDVVPVAEPMDEIEVTDEMMIAYRMEKDIFAGLAAAIAVSPLYKRVQELEAERGAMYDAMMKANNEANDLRAELTKRDLNIDDDGIMHDLAVDYGLAPEPPKEPTK